MLSEKYLAGFIDADGHLSVRARIGSRPDLEFEISQEVGFDEPVRAIHEMFGGYIRQRTITGGEYTYLGLRGGDARKLFERLKNYMLLKRHQATEFIEIVDWSPILKDRAEVVAIRTKVKEIRARGATRIPNYPSRKWMAGYVDGDGSFVVSRNGSGAYPALSILAAANYTVGIVLLRKAFGGRLCGVGSSALWQLALNDPSKIEQVVGFFARYLIKKKAQAYFLLGCAAGGNLRDGEAIYRAIRTLNAQQQRLSDPTAEASRLIKEIRFDLPPKRLGRPVGVSETKPRQKRQSDLPIASTQES